MSDPSNKEKCCPRFDPTPWDGKVYQWNDKRFIRGKVATFFHMPLNYGAVITRLLGQVEGVGARLEDRMFLADPRSKWATDLYVAVDRGIPGADNVILSGKFFSKVYEGPFSQIGKWCRDFGDEATQKGMAIQKLYLWYTTCPKCAKKHGKNYVVVVGKID